MSKQIYRCRDCGILLTDWECNHRHNTADAEPIGFLPDERFRELRREYEEKIEAASQEAQAVK